VISIVIPLKNGGELFRESLEAIAAQAIDEEVEIIVVDSGSTDGMAQFARAQGAMVHEIPPSEFSHGGTRNLGARLAAGEIIVFIVHDAVPAGNDWLERLVAPLRAEDGPAATYSRQLPRAEAPPHQRLYIEYRFGPRPRVQRASNPSELTTKTTLFSNVSSAIGADLLRQYPFAENIVVGEDGEWCARVLLDGHSVAYVPDSVVRHSHAYSLGGAFKRYFDLGVSSERTFLAPDRSSPAAVRSEGLAFVRREVSELWRRDRAGIPYALAHEATRYAAFRLGRRHRRIPRRLRRQLSATPSHWQDDRRLR